jgi:V/A-type H+-transporting ATPase subunit E
MDQVTELESAILARADRLAAEYRERAQRSCDNILREAHEHLRLREEREVLLAKARAERAYRRKVQANELKLHEEMDHLRWNLVEGVRERLSDRIADLVSNKEDYLPLLTSLLARGADEIEREELIAEVSASDLEWLQPRWAQMTQEAAPTKRIKLSGTPIETLGGVLIRSTDNRIRLDNTFEGRMERLSNRLHQIIIERLLPGGIENNVIFTG